MLLKLNYILWLGIIAFLIGLVIYPYYIKALSFLKIRKSLREDDATWQKSEIFNKLHGHKAGTPTMWWWVFLIIMLIMIVLSLIAKQLWYTNYDFTNFKETWLLMFGFFSMGCIWLVDDIFNVLKIWKVRWLSAKAKLAWMFLFSWFISYWFYVRLWVDTVNLRPIDSSFYMWIFTPIFFFVTTIAIVNAINITDGLDGLAWGLMTIIFLVLAVVAFMSWKFLTAAMLLIMIASLISFLWYNISPAKSFMWDSWAFAMWGLLSVTVYLLNTKLNIEWEQMEIWIILPFCILFGIFILELWSSFLQIVRKKRKKKKLFAIAPFHHLLEHKWLKEHTIVMKFWLIQAVLSLITLILIFYQIHSI